MSGEDDETKRECEGCGAPNRFTHAYCHACGRALGERRHASRTFPAVTALLETVLDFTGIALDDDGLKLVAEARELLATFEAWQKEPPHPTARHEALDRAVVVARALQAYRAR